MLITGHFIKSFIMISYKVDSIIFFHNIFLIFIGYKKDRNTSDHNRRLFMEKKFYIKKNTFLILEYLNIFV